MRDDEELDKQFLIEKNSQIDHSNINQESQLMIENEMTKKIEKIQYFLLICYFILIFCFIIFFVRDPVFQQKILRIIQKLEEDMNTFYMVCFVIFLTMVQILCLPIKPLEIATGMAFKNFWVGYLLVVLSKFLVTFPCYLIGKQVLKHKVEKLFESNLMFQALQTMMKESQWKSNFLIQICMIPLFLKLYGLPVLGSNFLPYCVIVTLVGCFYGFIILGVGREVYLISIGNIQNKSNYDQILLPIGIISFILIFYIGNQTYQKLQDQIQKIMDDDFKKTQTLAQQQQI